ncbi:unnamed protein product [Dibothriocephalus latus]|uniref:Uncharacterized protein n=1 Tax=Dibothriocephalus latus TaxID=60516 RepID=A0A3P7LZE0_DIBLA|nr:unnamed protein product [Dibothriocephalus latus]
MDSRSYESRALELPGDLGGSCDPVQIKALKLQEHEHGETTPAIAYKKNPLPIFSSFVEVKDLMTHGSTELTLQKMAECWRAGVGSSNFVISHANRLKKINSYLRCLNTTKDIPEAKRLISGAGDDVFTVRTDRQIENAIGVACEFGQLSEGWVAPDEDLVL